MPNNDWRRVYLQERRHPGYVIENGKSLIRRDEDTALQREVKARIEEKRKAA